MRLLNVQTKERMEQWAGKVAVRLPSVGLGKYPL